MFIFSVAQEVLNIFFEDIIEIKNAFLVFFKSLFI